MVATGRPWYSKTAWFSLVISPITSALVFF
jgi:hypothetical protein